jgi:hypothetical protein
VKKNFARRHFYADFCSDKIRKKQKSRISLSSALIRIYETHVKINRRQPYAHIQNTRSIPIENRRGYDPHLLTISGKEG